MVLPFIISVFEFRLSGAVAVQVVTIQWSLESCNRSLRFFSFPLCNVVRGILGVENVSSFSQWDAVVVEVERLSVVAVHCVSFDDPS